MASTISTTIVNSVTLGTGTYISPLTITNTGGIDAGTSSIALAMSTAGTILNAGTIIGGAGAIQIYDSFTGRPSGPGNDGAVGVQLAAGTLANSGAITGGAGGLVNSYFGGATNGAGGAGVTQSGGTLVNSGVITGGAGGFGNQYSVNQLGGNPGVYNSTNGGAGGTGAILNGGTFVNTGTVRGGTGGAAFVSPYGGGASAGTNGVGVSITSGLFIDNGSVSGSNAIAFGGTSTAELLVESAATFSGHVLENGDANATLALGGTTPFLLGSIGSSGEFVGFQHIALATGISGFGLSGDASGLATGETITGFTSGDTIILTGFTATSETYSNNALILSNGTTTETLDLSGFVDASQFKLSTGSAGTTIVGVFTSILSSALTPGFTLGTGSIANSVTISQAGTAIGAAGAAGVVMGSGQTLINVGTIFGGAGGSLGGAGVTINGGTLINAGTIAGGFNSASTEANAVTFGTNAATLIIESGAAFGGNIIANASVADVLEFAGTSTSLFFGIGTQEQNFKQISFASGAAWTIAGTAAGLASGQTITGFAIGDSIILDGFAATSETFVSGTGLELSNGSATDILNLTVPNSEAVALSTDGTNTTLTAFAATQAVSTALTADISLTQVTSPYGSPFTVTGSGAVTGITGANRSGTAAGDGQAGGAGGDAISNGTNATVTILGSVTGGAGGSGQAAPYSGGTGGAGGAGVTGLSAGTLKNNGTITGGAGGKGGGTGNTTSGAGGAGGVGVSVAAGETVINSGTIAGGAGSAGGTYNFNGGAPNGGAGGAGGAGLSISGGTLANSGLITGGAGATGAPSRAGPSGAQGVGGTGLYATSGSVLTNTGTIIGGNAGPIGGAGGYGSQSGPAAGGVGVALNGGTLFDAGTIIGGYNSNHTSQAAAISFGASAATLVVEAGAHFTGAVAAYAGAGDVLEFANGASVALGTSFTNFATTDILSGATATLSGTFASAVVNNGTIDTANGTSLVITGALTGTGTIIDDPATIVLDGSVSSGQTISLTGTGNVLELGDATQFNGTITGFTQGDTLLIDGFTATSASYASGELILHGSAGSTAETLTLAMTGSFASPHFTLSSTESGTDITLCFYPGTRIATAYGDIAVEDLREGMELLTANGPRPLRWLGRSDISTCFADPQRALPINIRAGALGNGLPLRDLLVSPDHAIFLDNMLVQASALVNGVSIRREHNVPEQFSYYHVELDSHELLLAEGVQTESFVDNASRMNFANWGERSAPATPIAELPYPRVKSHRQLPGMLKTKYAA